jgi:hypothetical protein
MHKWGFRCSVESRACDQDPELFYDYGADLDLSQQLALVELFSNCKQQLGHKEAFIDLLRERVSTSADNSLFIVQHFFVCY